MSEYVQFGLAMLLFISILAGSYWFVVFGPGRNEARQQEQGEQREAK